MNNVATLGHELRGKKVLLWTDLLSPETPTSLGIKFALALPTITHLCHHGARTLITIKSNHSISGTLNEVTDALRGVLSNAVNITSARGGIVDSKSSVNELHDGDILLTDEAAACTHTFDICVNDVFGSANEVADLKLYAGAGKNIVPCYAGIQFEKEWSLLKNLPQPVTIIVGDDPCPDKLNALVTLLHTPEKVEKILVGGYLVQYFHRALDRSTGDSVVEDASRVSLAQHVLQLAQQHAIPLVLATDALIVPTELVNEQSQHPQTGPTDTHGALNMDYSSHAAIRLGVKRVPLSVSPSPPGPLFQPAGEGRNASYDAVPPGFTCVDIGTETVSSFCNEMANSKSILMCGTMGMCEKSEFTRGTNCLLKTIAHRTDQGSVTVLCGDAIVSALERLQDTAHHLQLNQPQETQPQEMSQSFQDKGHEPPRKEEREAKLASSDQTPQTAPRELRYSYSLLSPGGCAALCALASLPLPGLDALHHD